MPATPQRIIPRAGGSSPALTLGRSGTLSAPTDGSLISRRWGQGVPGDGQGQLPGADHGWERRRRQLSDRGPESAIHQSRVARQMGLGPARIGLPHVVQPSSRHGLVSVSDGCNTSGPGRSAPSGRRTLCIRTQISWGLDLVPKPDSPEPSPSARSPICTSASGQTRWDYWVSAFFLAASIDHRRTSRKTSQPASLEADVQVDWGSPSRIRGTGVLDIGRVATWISDLRLETRSNPSERATKGAPESGPEVAQPRFSIAGLVVAKLLAQWANGIVDRGLEVSR